VPDELPFSVTTEPARAGVVAVVLGGEVDTATAPEVEHALIGAIRRNDAMVLIVDMTAVTFIDSSGLGALVRAFERNRQAGRGRVAIVSQDPHLTKLLEITGLERVLRRFDSRDEAIASL
jgi:anti-anti-sigma factor